MREDGRLEILNGVARNPHKTTVFETKSDLTRDHRPSTGAPGQLVEESVFPSVSFRDGGPSTTATDSTARQGLRLHEE